MHSCFAMPLSMCKTLCCSLKKVDESSMVRILLVRSSHRKNTFQISHSRSLLNLELWYFQRLFLSDLTGTSVTQTLIHLDPWLLEEYHHHTKSLAMWIGSFSRDLTSDAFWYITVIYGIWHSENNQTYALDAPLLVIWVPSISISARFEDDNARDMKRPYRKHIQRIEAYLLWMLCGYVASYFLWWLTSMSPMPSEFPFRNCLGDGKERRIWFKNSRVAIKP